MGGCHTPTAAACSLAAPPHVGGLMHLSVLALSFLVMGIGTGWVTSIFMRFYRPAASTRRLLQAVARWLFVAAFGMGAAGFFLMGVVMLWYPADARGYVHTPDGSLGSA